MVFWQVPIQAVLPQEEALHALPLQGAQCSIIHHQVTHVIALRIAERGVEAQAVWASIQPQAALHKQQPPVPIHGCHPGSSRHDRVQGPLIR